MTFLKRHVKSEIMNKQITTKESWTLEREKNGGLEGSTY